MALLLTAGLASEPLSAASPGCSAETPPTSGNLTLPFDGIDRTYRVHVPADYDRQSPAPMVLLFHGWGGDENEFLANEVVRAEADQRGYILVAPRGLGSGSPDQRLNSWSFSGSTSGVDGSGNKICDDAKTPDYSYPSCNASGIAKNTCSWTHCQGSETSDVAFALALAEEIGQKLCVDTERVYASGASNGGMFAWELGQNEASAPLFRAIAPIIGLPHRDYLDGPPKGFEMPALLITGINDATVPPGTWEDEGFTTTSDGDFFHYSSATAITRSWSKAHGCPTDLPAVVFDTGTAQADCRSYCSTNDNWPPVLDCRANMGHETPLDWNWPLVLDFFDAHSEG